MEAGQLASEVAPRRQQTPLQIANEARQELTATTARLKDAQALLARIKPDKERIAVGDYVKKLEEARKELVISNFEAWKQALFVQTELIRENKGNMATLNPVRNGFNEASRLLKDVAPELLPEPPKRPFEP